MFQMKSHGKRQSGPDLTRVLIYRHLVQLKKIANRTFKTSDRLAYLQYKDKILMHEKQEDRH